MTLNVKAAMWDQTILDLGQATYDEDSDRLILIPTNKDKLCINGISLIRFGIP